MTARAIPTPARCFACGTSDEERAKGRAETPTVAVFVRGGLVQDVCFAGRVRVVVVDFDVDEPKDAAGVWINPIDGRASYARASMWTQRDNDITRDIDDEQVREAVRVATDPWLPFRDNEEERARIQRECNGEA